MAKKKVVAKKSTNKKSSVKKSKPVKKVAAKAVKTSKKSAPVKASAKKATKKLAVKKSPAKKSIVKKSVAKKSSPKKAPFKKTAKAINKRTPKKTASPQKAAAKVSAKKPVALKAPVMVAPKVKKLDLTHFVTPLDDRLMVQVSGTERMTPGGLYIPDTVADVSGNLHGVVVSVGRGHMGKKGHVLPMDVKVGDSIVFAEHSGSKIKIQNEDLIILRESEVMGVVAK